MPARIARAHNLPHSSRARDAPFLCSRARERAQGGAYERDRRPQFHLLPRPEASSRPAGAGPRHRAGRDRDSCHSPGGGPLARTPAREGQRGLLGRWSSGGCTYGVRAVYAWYAEMPLNR
ncbi:hypothetical protein TPA0910_27210 [Streptomyces hygroscopicus subsp. sporocinereus]|uniref:Uncharacterized protein n=1 Tax=Streptomyces hygroscopicus TaxID=1912 RepID=A0ABQ3TYC0_STRHY|nr:hypothetical protein TPA0910_27210 [Streptomyces hygroscopicus]